MICVFRGIMKKYNFSILIFLMMLTIGVGMYNITGNDVTVKILILILALIFLMFLLYVLVYVGVSAYLAARRRDEYKRRR